VAQAISVKEATRSVFIAWRLFHRDRQVVELIDDSYAGVVRSFWAAALVLPLYIVYLLLQVGTPTGNPGNFGTLVEHGGLFAASVSRLTVYAMGFVAWPLLMHYLAPRLDCDRHYFRYLVAYNWMNAVNILVLLTYGMLRFSGLVPEEMANLAAMITLTIMWAYHWFVARETLDINGGIAATLVAGEYLLTAIIADIGVSVIM